MYAIPKMHKTPVKFRFIVSCKDTAIKPIAKTATLGMKICQKQHEIYCKVIRNYTGINRFFIAENSQKISGDLNFINSKSIAKSVDTFDFTSLYTFIPHDSLKQNLDWYIDKAFNGAKGRGKQFMSIYNKEAKWVSKHRETTCAFDKLCFQKLQHFIINNSYFMVGNIILRQEIGIPMGIDPAPFYANGHLYKYEFDFQEEMTKKNYTIAKSLNHTHRYIDDISPLNDRGNFEKFRQDIYPPELILVKQNNSEMSASVLDIQIDVVENKFQTKVFDKRDDFPFNICRYPSLSSNIPDITLYNVFYSQILRIYRICNILNSFISSVKALVQRCIAKGGTRKKLKFQIKKFFERHKPFKFDILLEDMLIIF